MRFAVSTTAALETQEAAADSKPPKQDGAITASTAHTLPVLSWVVP